MLTMVPLGSSWPKLSMPNWTIPRVVPINPRASTNIAPAIVFDDVRFGGFGKEMKYWREWLLVVVAFFVD
jgi:hypothetical protein